MSVHGEFRRILGDATATLRVEGHIQLAGRLEILAAHGDTLDAQAGAVLGAIEPIEDPALRANLEHLESLCRVIRG